VSSRHSVAGSTARRERLTELEHADAALVARYPVQTVGARRHQELWVPAEELEEFNRHIVGPIEVIAEFRGT
jgi:hypothetical protein